MAELQETQVNIVLSVLLMLLFGHAYLNMDRKKSVNRIFLCIMGTTLLATILETVSVLLNNPNLKQYIILNRLVNVTGFIVTPCIPFLAYVFIKKWFDMYNRKATNGDKILLLPLVINGVASLISYSKGIMFNITSDNVYERGPLFFILPCVCYFYFGYNIYFIYKHRRKLSYSNFVVFSLFFIVPAIFTSIQLKYNTCLTTWNSAVIVVVVAYIFILNDKAYRDSLTGLQNRFSYEHYAQRINDKMLNNLFMVYIDLDDLKNINDKYGHHEGDEAIKTFAKLLYLSFPMKHKKLIRLGGDEFLIILEEREKKNVEDYMKNLSEHIEEYNNKDEKPYRLTFSYGMACYTKVYKNFGELLEDTDKMMYEQKQRKKIVNQ